MDGWKLVPVEPDETMSRTAAEAFEKANSKTGGVYFFKLSEMHEALRAAITAAPSPPADPRDGEIERLREERDDLERRLSLLAGEMVYDGNSVQHWVAKARAYKECAGVVYELKQLLSVNSPTEVLAAVKSLRGDSQHGEVK
jgi:hypothetical protein